MKKKDKNMEEKSGALDVSTRAEGTLMPVTKAAVKELENQRKLLREFVSGQLVEAKFDDAAKSNNSYGEGDYGVIPGTKKRCLFKSGAEKLNRLFNLGVRFKVIDKTIDRDANFAMYNYQAEIYVIRTGHVVATCDGTANSQEVKYKERTVWKKIIDKKTGKKTGSEQTTEETPIFDILNTLQKMAQKRAFVGATLLATGASEYFTQDMLEPEDLEPESEEPKDVTPKNESTPTPQDTPPMCCGKKMVESKYVDRKMGHKPWYCMECQSKVPKVTEQEQETGVS